jgi:hypothetical protein
MEGQSMRQSNGLMFGWVDSDIRSVILQGILSEFHSVLITSLDSARDLNGLAQRMLSGTPTSLLGPGFVVSGKAIAEIAASKNLFVGFDEVWCFQTAPTTVKSVGGIVGPKNLNDDPLPPETGAWMIDTNCQLGLGDGIGLNFVTPQREIANAILKMDGTRL